MTRPLPIRAMDETRCANATRTRRNSQAAQRTVTADRQNLCCLTIHGPTRKCKLHVYTAILTSLAGCIIMGFVLYDLVDIAMFQKHYKTLKQEEFQDYRDPDTGEIDQEKKVNGVTLEEFKALHKEHSNQEAMAIVLLLMLSLFILSGFGVYVGYKQRTSILFVPFLILTFLILTFAMVYSILFKVEENTTVVYIKIITVVVIYTILANVYRGVYRAYHQVKRENRRSTHRDEHLPTVSQTIAPVVLQMKPPPYEKEPPPYSLIAPDISSPPYTPSPNASENGTFSAITTPQYTENMDLNSQPSTTCLSNSRSVNVMSIDVPLAPSHDGAPPPYSAPIASRAVSQGVTVTSHTACEGHTNVAIDLSDENITNVHL